MADISSVKLPDGNSYNIKDSSARSSLSSAGTKSTLSVVERYDIDNITINAYSSSASEQVSIAKSGYTVLGIGGWALYNASSGGKNCSWCRAYKSFFSSANAAMAVRNYANDTAKVKCQFWVIYHKN